EGLRRAGYRPVRARPWTHPQPPHGAGPGGVVGEKGLVAVVWARDGRPWKLETGLTAKQVHARDRVGRKEGLLPVDVAGYRMAQGERYSFLWRLGEKDEEAAVYAGLAASFQVFHWNALKQAGFVAATIQGVTGQDGVVRYSGVWYKSESKGSINVQAVGW